MYKQRKFWEVEVSNDEETVSVLFENDGSAKLFADDCQSIGSVTMVVCSGPYRVYSRESMAIAYARTWNQFNKLKGEENE